MSCQSDRPPRVKMSAAAALHQQALPYREGIMRRCSAADLQQALDRVDAGTGSMLVCSARIFLFAVDHLPTLVFMH
jgi:hypothetical protein